MFYICSQKRQWMEAQRQGRTKKKKGKTQIYKYMCGTVSFCNVGYLNKQKVLNYVMHKLNRYLFISLLFEF